MTFTESFLLLMKHEGGYSNSEKDNGGETMYGVTEKVARVNGYAGDMHNLPIEFAQRIAKASYWNPCRCDDLPAEVRFSVFDGAYNSGVAQAVRWLQRAAGANADGVMGSKTMQAVNAIPGAVLTARFNGHRLEFMSRLSTWPVFGAGWARRVAANLQAVDN